MKVLLCCARAAGIAALSLALPHHAVARPDAIACADSTRPHCPYPEEAVYDGAGDPNQAASYSSKKLD